MDPYSSSPYSWYQTNLLSESFYSPVPSKSLHHNAEVPECTPLSSSILPQNIDNATTFPNTVQFSTILPSYFPSLPPVDQIDTTLTELNHEEEVQEELISKPVTTRTTEHIPSKPSSQGRTNRLIKPSLRPLPQYNPYRLIQTSETLEKNRSRNIESFFPTTNPFLRFDALAWLFTEKMPNAASTFVSDDHGETPCPITIPFFDGVSIRVEMLKPDDISLHAFYNTTENLSFSRRSSWYANTRTTHLRILSERISCFVYHEITLPPLLQNNRYLHSLYENEAYHHRLKSELGIFFNAVVIELGQDYLDLRTDRKRMGRPKPIPLPSGISSFEELVNRVAQDTLRDWAGKSFGP